MTDYIQVQFARLLPYFEQAHTAYFNKFQMTGKQRTSIRKFVLYAIEPLPAVAAPQTYIILG